MGFVITIDGPAASGKSSVSRELARRLGCRWVSTGAFYRGLAYLAHETRCDLDDPLRLVALAKSSDWEVKLTPEQTLVLYRGRDVTPWIHREDVGSIASRISHYGPVRAALLEAQRRCAEGPEGLIAEGRDCGTVVFPDANVKLYLTATGESRAHRRASEQGEDPDRILAAQRVRDTQDSTRKAAPLTIPANALVIDSSDMDFQSVVARAEMHIRENLGMA